MPDRTPLSDDQPELLYVSWGGTGRAEAVRLALARAGASGRGLVYLAILDDSTFGDIDPKLLELAREELSWLLDAQLDLTRSQTNLDDVPVRVLVRAGDVADRIGEAAEAVAASEVLMGAPVSDTDAPVVEALVTQLRQRLSMPVEFVDG